MLLIRRPACPFVTPPSKLARRSSRSTSSSAFSSRSPSSSSSWRPSSALDEWVEREARPVSLRQLTVFGRSLTESRLLSSANYVRTELPTRLAHRIRDLQTLPYIFMNNVHMSYVYELYYNAFDSLRRIPEVRTIADNDRLCSTVQQSLIDHLPTIPRLVRGILECEHIAPDNMDALMSTLLKSRISRRVIAEQHLALTETYHSPWHFPSAPPSPYEEFIGEVFLRISASDVITRCASAVSTLLTKAYGPSIPLPEVKLTGNLDATLTYIPQHLEYIVGELLRNSFQALIERNESNTTKPPPIQVLICESPQDVFFRISDVGGGIPPAILPYLWSFVGGPRSALRLANLNKVPHLSATLQELGVTDHHHGEERAYEKSLKKLAIRPPNLRLGIGLPMSRLYAEYWAGSLEVRSVEGYGVDAFLGISKLGNKNEQLSTRALMDSL